ncbi:MAG: flagellar hook-length control protein FliK, partial [Planctomycetota bacterium]
VESGTDRREPIVITGNPSATTDETLISVTTPTETPSADDAAFDANDTVAVPADRIMPAVDPNTVVANTIATAISPAQFAAAQEAIQQAAAPVAVEPVAPPVDLRAKLTQAQASSAGLHSAVIGKQQTTGPVSPSAPSTIIDQRTQPKPTTTTNGPTPAATPSTVIEPVTTSQPVDQTTTSTQPTPAPTTSGAEVRAAEATTERQAAPLAQPAQATTTAVAEVSTTSTSNVAAPKPIATAKPDLPAPVSREQFVAQNEPSVVRSVSGLVKDNGGEMRIRLDPPSLGNVSVRVKMVGGAAEVSFVTPSGDAAKALGQSLHALKQSLETAGIQVDRLNVRQAQPTDSQSNTNSDTRGGDDPAARDQRQNEQHRAREELAKRWRNVIYGDDLEADLAA